MIPMVAVVGFSNSGKTTLLEKLIREITRRGYRVATVKHHGHDLEIDQPGKDTWRHAQAGAEQVIISTPSKLAMFKQVKRELTLDEIAALITGVDLILVEGYKRGDKPKIEVFRSAVCRELISPIKELLAIASDKPFDLGVPCFDLDDAVGLANLLERKYLT